MKFAMNSSLIIGTLDGANIEIGDAIGRENVFFFGAKVDEVENIRLNKANKGNNIHSISTRLHRIFKAIRDGFFGPNEYDCIIDSIMTKDHYLCGYDFDDYIDAQKRVDIAYQDKDKWIKMCITSSANMGYFNSDRTISEYAEQIWDVHPCPLPPVIEGNDNIAVVSKTSSIKSGSQTVGSLRRHHQGSLVKNNDANNTFIQPDSGSAINEDNNEDGGIPIEL
ncbi:hypothetical protein TRFO_04767 [Tritrichomonas foetus]|uniref:Alpha-1,4 glucan phosphorylase n=1 Tax=Tritrichomonas foetus TaxID=1144522 RepID=A0A1J4KBA2_9EUKA|nr:hypothetical protein TRFO_04767 [Tritrichomonas foetus]|eukprot:OHT08697.1 hypothetical protein TRFO_04767 [Tritrichomonas foetus]